MDFNIPFPKNPDKTIRVVAVDPGTSHLGLAVMDWEWGDAIGTVVWADTIHVRDETHPDMLAESCGKRDYRLNILKEYWEEFVYLSGLTFAVTETPFLKKGKMSAYESGIELQKLLREGLYRYYPSKHLHGFQPMLVKAHVGVVARGTDKTHMFTAVSKMFTNHTLIDLETLDEHSIDAIAVGNTFIRTSLLGLENLLPKKEKVKKDVSKGRRVKGRRKRNRKVRRS